AGYSTIKPGEIENALPAEKRSLRKNLLAELEAARTEAADLESAPQVYAANPETPAPTFVLVRGDVESPSERAFPCGLSSVRSLPADLKLGADSPDADRRMKLADWITDPRNPLTARVMVNRIWHYHFGTGIVNTPNDFGFNGDKPSHP